MSYYIEGGIRKNKYFSEEGIIPSIQKFEKIGEERKEGGPNVKLYESAKIDEVVEESFANLRLEEVKSIGGRGRINYEVSESIQKELHYKNAAVREVFYLKEGVELNLKSFFDGVNYIYREFFVKEGARVRIRNFSKANRFFEMITIINLNGERSEGYERSAIYCEKGQARTFTILKHNAENTVGDSDVRAVLRNDSKISIEGIIRIEPTGRFTNSYLHQHAILFEESEGYAFPALEIENKEVRASHSASVKQISEEDLFYMESRGINKKEAEELIVEGFLSI